VWQCGTALTLMVTKKTWHMPYHHLQTNVSKHLVYHIGLLSELASSLKMILIYILIWEPIVGHSVHLVYENRPRLTAYVMMGFGTQHALLSVLVEQQILVVVTVRVILSRVNVIVL
jgi:hypothetical protein